MEYNIVIRQKDGRLIWNSYISEQECEKANEGTQLDVHSKGISKADAMRICEEYGTDNIFEQSPRDFPRSY